MRGGDEGRGGGEVRRRKGGREGKGEGKRGRGGGMGKSRASNEARDDELQGKRAEVELTDHPESTPSTSIFSRCKFYLSELFVPDFGINLILKKTKFLIVTKKTFKKSSLYLFV